MAKLSPSGHIVIENIQPQIDAGRFAIKRVQGDRVEVSADIFRDGHELLKACIVYRLLPHAETPDLSQPHKAKLRAKHWLEQPLTNTPNDCWNGHFGVDEVGPWTFSVLAWTDTFSSWRAALKKKFQAGQKLDLDLREGAELIRHYARKARGQDKKDMLVLATQLEAGDDDKKSFSLAQHPRLIELMTRNDPRDDATIYPWSLPVWVDRRRAQYGAWYEMFPRSQGQDPTRSATFAEAAQRLPEISELGFDIVYLPPIHPIGEAFRKGANNSESARPGEPGSPWAIGNQVGGHMSVHPELGGLDDFVAFVEHAKKLDIEIALDFAVQCSPDHPWVIEHPDWFKHRADGTVQYAENPPKKYQDIYPIDFATRDRDGLYQALLEVVLFWMQQGVRVFRVDNPHTKPAGFWEWLIREVHRRDPSVLFLAEAFTRPKPMQRLAKLGFSQSYSYFTWRNSAEELSSYAEELFNSSMVDFYRPNFFANTPDILHEFLQNGGRAGFLIRLLVAALQSPTYGIYSGFELCEAQALKLGSEEYLDSEKYQYRIRDWNLPGHIKAEISKINAIRRAHPALQQARNYQTLPCEGEHLFAFAKSSEDAQDRLIVVVNVDPHEARDGRVFVDAAKIPQLLWGPFGVEDLLTGERYDWRPGWNYVRLDPRRQQVGHVLKILVNT